MLRKWGWSARTPVSKTAIFTFAPVKPLAQSFSASNMDVICDLCSTCHKPQKSKTSIKTNTHTIPGMPLAAPGYHVDALELCTKD